MQHQNPNYQINNNITTFEEPKEQMEIYLSARNLKKMDIMSNTDCKMLLFSKQPNNALTLIGETETINNNLNPNFTTSFCIDFYFERHQFFQVQCLDVENKSETKYEEMGIFEFELGKVAGSPNNMLILDIMKKGKTNGKGIIRVESVSEGPQYNYKIQLRGLELTNFGLIFNRIKPHLVISKPKLNKMALNRFAAGDAKLEDLQAESWITVYQSGEMKDKSPLYPLLHVTLSKLSGGNLNNPIKVKKFFS